MKIQKCACCHREKDTRYLLDGRNVCVTCHKQGAKAIKKDFTFDQISTTIRAKISQGKMGRGRGSDWPWDDHPNKQPQEPLEKAEDKNPYTLEENVLQDQSDVLEEELKGEFDGSDIEDFLECLLMVDYRLEPWLNEKMKEAGIQSLDEYASLVFTKIKANQNNPVIQSILR